MTAVTRDNLAAHHAPARNGAVAKIQKTEQASQRSPEELDKLLEKQRKHQELIARFNAKFSRPGAWTIGKELGELPLAIGIVNAITKHGPRREIQ